MSDSEIDLQRHPTGVEETQAMRPIDVPTSIPEMKLPETDPLDKGDTLPVGDGTVIVSGKDKQPYIGGSSPQGYVTSLDKEEALGITYSEMVDQLKMEVLNGKKTKEDAIEAVKAYAKDHQLPADSIKLNF